jgi:hypothetical protein
LLFFFFFYFRFSSSLFLSFIENQLLRSATARGKFLYLVALVSTTVAKFLLRVVNDSLRVLQLTLFRSAVAVIVRGGFHVFSSVVFLSSVSA